MITLLLFYEKPENDNYWKIQSVQPFENTKTAEKYKNILEILNKENCIDYMEYAIVEMDILGQKEVDEISKLVVKTDKEFSDFDKSG